jgi:hypothetical protein
VHVHDFSCVHRTFRMLQMLIGIIFGNLVDNIIKKTVRQETTCLLMRIKNILSNYQYKDPRMCFPLPGRGHKSPSGHRRSFRHHFLLHDRTGSHCALNKRIQLTLNLNIHIMTLELQVKKESRLPCDKQIMSVINNPRWIPTVHVKQRAFIQE